MADLVKDAILTGDVKDPVLSQILELTINSIATDRQLFPNVLTEPAFYRRYIITWVREGIEERKLLDVAGNKAKSILKDGA
jgi:hypothetical protein